MAKIPWDYIGGADHDTGVPNAPSPEGEALGREVARLAVPALARMRELYPTMPLPCAECAFVAGTVPNRCLPTVADALKAVVEDGAFWCHKGAVDGDPQKPCAGFVASVAAAHGRLKPMPCASCHSAPALPGSIFCGRPECGSEAVDLGES